MNTMYNNGIYQGKETMEALCCYSFMWYNTIMLESKRCPGRREAKSPHHLKWLFPLFLFSQDVHCSPSWQFCTMWMTTSVFLPHCGIAALLHFFGKCHTYNYPKGTKKEKNLLQNIGTHMYISL